MKTSLTTRLSSGLAIWALCLLLPTVANAQCDVILDSPGGAKLNVVKAVKAITGYGLKEAKELVDRAPSTIAEDVTEDEALSIATLLEEAGAEVSLECPESEEDSETETESPCSATVSVTGGIDASVLDDVTLLLEDAGCGVSVVTGEDTEEAAEECDSYQVVLDAPGGAKLNVVKAVKSITGLGLKEAKELVDSAPNIIREGLTLEEAQSIESQLEDAGAEATVECD